jgi:Glycosyltransferase
MERINVLHLINYPGNGGSEKYILSLADKLHGDRCRFFLAASTDGPMIENVKARAIDIDFIPMKNPFDIRAAFMLKRLCKRLSIDIVHTHFLRENFIGALSKILGNRIALINTVHMMDRKNGLIRTANRIMSNFDDAVIAVSQAVSDIQLEEGISADKLKLIYNGVDITCSNGRVASNFRKANKIGGDEFLITSAARFSEEKGHLFFLEAISRFKATLESQYGTAMPKVKFVLAGEGVLLEECRKRATDMELNDIILFTGYFSNINALLKETDLFISHSTKEALGISILEALACGIPAIVTNSGGTSEIVNETTGCGLLVNNGDVAGLSSAMVRMVTDRVFYSECRSKAVKTVEERFTLDKMAGDTLELYIKCLGEN